MHIVGVVQLDAEVPAKAEIGEILAVVDVEHLRALHLEVQGLPVQPVRCVPVVLRHLFRQKRGGVRRGQASICCAVPDLIIEGIVRNGHQEGKQAVSQMRIRVLRGFRVPDVGVACLAIAG